MNVLHFYPFVGVGGAMNAMITLVAEQESLVAVFLLTLVYEPHCREHLPNTKIIAVARTVGQVEDSSAEDYRRRDRSRG